MNQRTTRYGVAVAMATLVVCNASRADVFWIGAGATNNWSNAANWDGLNRPNNNGNDDVYMSDILQHTTNTVNQDYWISRLIFDPTDGREASWTINNSNDAILSLNRGIGNSTSKTQTVNAPLRLRDNIYIGNNGDGTQNRGTINVGSTIDLNGKDLRLSASPSGINLTGAISGAGSLTFDGAGPVTLSGSNSFVGTLTIKKGSVTANAGINLGSIGNRVIFSQSDANSIPTLVRNGSGTIGIPLNFESGEGRIETPAGVTVTISSRLESSGFVANFAKTGAGRVVLSAPATQYGLTIVRAGTLQLSADLAVSKIGMQVLNGATLLLDANRSQSVRSLDGFGAINLGSASNFGIGQNDDPTSTTNGIGTFGGVISGSPAVLIKEGAGAFTLSGNNTYSGNTVVRGGVLVANSAATGSSSTGTSTVTVKIGTRLAGGGLISGPVVIDGGGTIAPSNVSTPDAGIGSLWVGSLLLGSTAVTRLDFNSSDIDRINSNSTATLDGELQLNKIGSTIPFLYASRQILSTLSGRTGVFSSITGVSLTTKESWAVTYTPTGVFATIATPGDATLDRSVNFDDLLQLAANYNASQTKTWSDGDFTGDGAVNFDDLLILASKYNTAGGAVGGDWALAQAAVPEPTSLATIAIAISAVLGRRRR
jgi:autotransporter-associated beta strand protein